MEDNPFPGAAELAYVRKKSKKQLKREAKDAKEKAASLVGMIGDVKCMCGEWQRYQCTLHYIHDDNCIINTSYKRK